MLKFRTHGKWILAGEHTVLRGGTALVFPVQSRFLDFSFESGNELKLDIQHQNNDLEMAFWGVLERALQKLGLKREQVAGTLRLESNIPVGAGMGASATLCVSLARWFCELGYLKENQRYEFAKDLENLFHGESSGVDVAVALNHQGLSFRRQEMQEFVPQWQPHFFLSYCGKRGVTADCISRVQHLMKESPELGQEIDNQMSSAVAMAQEALLSNVDLPRLTTAIELASDCFKKWGLVSLKLQEHMDFLYQQGALACKPTGSGDGGFVLSLWKESPQDTELQDILIRA